MNKLYLLVNRRWNNKLGEYVIGNLSYKFNESDEYTFFCDTLEDYDRGLDYSMDLKTLQSIKVYGRTAIPTGTYKLVWDYSPKFKRSMPHVLGVPAYSSIRIHPGNTIKDTLGCLLIGENKVKGKVLNSRKWFNEFEAKFKSFKDVEIKYIRSYKI